MSDFKTIDHDTYLKALAMSVMSNDLYVQAREMQLRLEEMLGTEDGSHVSDAIYSGSKIRISEFDEALKREGIKVEASTA
jgi:hypothetical protein